MPRKVIYIKNPKEGSNFRTVGGDGGGGTKPPARKKPGGTTKSPGGHREHGTWGRWIPDKPTGAYVDIFNVFHTSPDDWNPPDYSNWYKPKPHFQEPVYYVGGARGMIREPEYTDFPMTRAEFYAIRYANTGIWTTLFDIARGIDPRTGQRLPPLGTPGQLKAIIGTGLDDVLWENVDAGRYSPGRNVAPQGGSDPATVGGQPHVSGYWWTQPTSDPTFEAGDPLKSVIVLPSFKRKKKKP